MNTVIEHSNIEISTIAIFVKDKDIFGKINSQY
ncbi:hypothetical protein M2263_000836 [Providencia alcalifaciens]|nr:hypothetical protein [Providencia alcalifaciens]